MNEKYNYRATQKPLHYDLRILDEQKEIVDHEQVVETFILAVIFLAVVWFVPGEL